MFSIDISFDDSTLIWLDLFGDFLFRLFAVFLLVIPFVELLMRTQIDVASVNKLGVFTQSLSVSLDLFMGDF
jgi:hypothetical protein